MFATTCLRLLVNALLPMVMLGTMVSAQAQSLIVTEERDGSSSRIWLHEDRARVQGSGTAYLLIHTRYERLDAVFPDTGDIIDLTRDLPPVPDAPSNSNHHVTSLQHRDGGPRVAGYSTERYLLVGNGRPCGEVLLSREVLERTGAAGYLRTMSHFNQRQRRASRQAGEELGPCEAALHHALDQFPELGYPMRSEDADGNRQQQVIAVQADTTTEPGFFELP